MIAIHALLVLAILVIGSDFAVIDGGAAEQLALPGAWIAPFVPLMAVGVYLLIVSLARKAAKRFTRKAAKWSIRIAAVLVGYLAACTLLAYPCCLLTWYSQRIEIAEFVPDAKFLPHSVVRDFEQRFDTPTVQYDELRSDGPCLLVPRDKFKESMISFLQTRTAEAERAKNKEGKEYGGPTSS